MIIQNNEELLRRPCEEVKPEEVGELVELLERELENSARLGNPGIGLSAIQIGILKKIAIVRISPELSVNLINAKIEKGYDEIMFQNEGCLSFPNRLETTKRFQEVHIVNNLESPKSFVATGLFSICCQHELEHGDGILFIDKAIKKVSQKLGPNDPCICGKIDPISGRVKKFKKCCGAF